MFRISIQNLGYAWPNGQSVFDNLTFTLQKEKIGLVGDNGSGKTTLLRLIQGLLVPASGRVEIEGKMAVVRQIRTFDPEQSVAAFLGVAPKLHALWRILGGVGTEGDLTLLDNDWDLELRIARAMTDAGLESIGMDRVLQSLSGGELTRLALAAAWLPEPDFILLDEPSNHLDAESRSRLREMVKKSRSGFLVASHDRALLREMDAILELSPRGLQRYGGNFDAYEEQKEKEQAAALQAYESAQARLKQQERNAREVRERQEKRNAAGAKYGKAQNLPKDVINKLRGDAERTLHKGQAVQEKRTQAQLESMRNIKDRLEPDRRIKIDLNAGAVSAGKVMVRLEGVNFGYEDGEMLWDEPLSWSMNGTDKVWLKGANGSGKSTLIKMVMGDLQPDTGQMKAGARQVLLLDQNLSLLESEMDLLDNLRQFAPDAMPEHELRTRLARFLFRDDKVFQTSGKLSGGERMRLALACLLAMEPAPEMLILDEPTNNLDLRSTAELAEVLSGFQGAVLMVTHDEDFARDSGMSRSLSLERK